MGIITLRYDLLLKIDNQSRKTLYHLNKQPRRGRGLVGQNCEEKQTPGTPGTTKPRILREENS